MFFFLLLISQHIFRHFTGIHHYDHQFPISAADAAFAAVDAGGAVVVLDFNTVHLLISPDHFFCRDVFALERG